MNPSRALLAAAALAAGVLAAPSLDTATSVDQQDLEQQVADQAVRLEAAEAELEELRAQTLTLSRACGQLGLALNSSRENGFEYAGANPQAKTDLLEGLMEFSAAVGSATAPPRTNDD